MKYGFITFVRPCDAYTAIDDSSKNSAICHYDISFGGRRAFCRQKYFDLGEFQLANSMAAISIVWIVFQNEKKSKLNQNKCLSSDNSGTATYHDDSVSPQKPVKENDDSFEALLRKVKEKLQEKK